MMRKLKHAICPKCNQKIHRHDPNRINKRIADGSNGQGVFKDFHLECY